MTGVLDGRTVLVSGGSRGIGLSIATAAAAHGANVVLFAKSDGRSARLPVGVHRAVEQVKAAGADVIVVAGDGRIEEDVERVVDAAAAAFGGIDCCVNAASASALDGTEDLSPDRFDLMSGVNLRGTFLLTRACIPFLRKSDRAHILTIAPPIMMSHRWLAPHLGYTATRYGMTVLGLGFAAEFGDVGIASNCLWPQSALIGGSQLHTVPPPRSSERTGELSRPAQAAVNIISGDPRVVTGNCYVDDQPFYSQTATRPGGSVHDAERWLAGDL